MNKNLIIVLAGGLLIAVIVAVLVQASMGSSKKKEKVAEAATKTVQVIVAAKNLPVGTQLSEENMKWQEWPQSGLFEGAIVKKDGKKMTEMVSGRLRRALNAGEPVVKSALVSEGDGNFVAASLRDGMRAVAIDANPVLLAGNMIKPGDFVDVILTYKAKVAYDGDDPTGKINTMIELSLDKMATETILQNVRIIAVGDKYKDAAAEAAADPNAKPAKSSSKAKSPKVKTVTLEVDPRGAEVLALAKDMGKITLSLRKLGDDTYFDHNYGVITDAKLTKILDEIFGNVEKIQKTSGQNGNIVRIYNGYQQEQVRVVP